MSEQLLKKIESLEDKIKFYEQDGAAKLYYSLQRKMNEIADILNNIKLSSLALDDRQDKTFERLKVLWTDSKVISEAAKILGDAAGVTGDEKKDVNKKGSFLDKVVN
tara:strand:- start:5809 stop:6129 length:321 start_codon:yes stop_codon:yes gene_type:complete